MMQAVLADVAFGGDPGRWPLPTANTSVDLWLRAVAAGGQGRYGIARTDLDTLCRREPAGPLASLAHSTQASFLRQLGGHRLARGWDGRAIALAMAVDSHASTSRLTEATVDALIGLAADALGVGRFAASATLLERARDELTAADRPAHRLKVRLAWVGAELAMATGDGTTAVDHALRAVELAAADDPVSERHQVKSEVVLAAALCSAARLPQARAVADAAFEATGRCGLVPLRWALACLLADIGSPTQSARAVLAERDACADLVARRGGHWSAR
jgi:hypothetical protein